MPDHNLPADLIGRTPALPSGARLSPGLRTALAAPSRVGTDPKTGEAVVLPGSWTCPRSVCPDVQGEAARRAAALDQLLAKRPEIDITRLWLSSLGPLVASGRMTADDATVKLHAYCGLLDFPSAVYSQDSLRRAAERFDFFPSFKELSGFLNDEMGRLREQASRCRQLATAGGARPVGEPWAPPDDASKARVSEMVADAVEALRTAKPFSLKDR